METIKYIIDSKGKRCGLFINLDIARKTFKRKKDLVELLEDIEDTIAVELRNGERSIPYEEARKQIFKKRK